MKRQTREQFKETEVFKLALHQLVGMRWQLLTKKNHPPIGEWVLISDGTDWRRVYVAGRFEFVEHPHDVECYGLGITHWCDVYIP